jgi:hypothetical protein
LELKGRRSPRKFRPNNNHPRFRQKVKKNPDIVFESFYNDSQYGYPASAPLRSAAVPEVTSLRRLQFGQINSHRHAWVFKSPQHAPPKKVTKKRYGIRTTINEFTRYEVGTAGPRFEVVSCGCRARWGEAHGHPHSPKPVCYLFAFPLPQGGRMVYQPTRNRRFSGVCPVEQRDWSTPWPISGWPRDLEGPKSQLTNTSKTQNLQKLTKTLWGQEESCWEGPV